MKLFKPFLALLLTGLLFTNCKKSSNPAPKSKTDLVTASSWKFDDATVGGIDVSSLLESCEKDNTLVFASSGSGTLDEGATKCNSSDPQTDSFTWNFASSESVLHISQVLFTGGSSDFNIITLSATQLVLSQNVDVSGTTENAVITFKH